MLLKQIDYKNLNARQKENYNFHKASARLADYGFNSMRLNDDWQGADFIACHIDGEVFIKVQLKARFTLDKKYNDKNIYIMFSEQGKWYLYPHDTVQDEVTKKRKLKLLGTKSWDERGKWTQPKMSRAVSGIMQEYSI